MLTAALELRTQTEFAVRYVLHFVLICIFKLTKKKKKYTNTKQLINNINKLSSKVAFS